MSPVVDLVIPMLNEAENIGPLFDGLDRLRERGVIRHVVVGDNGSEDETPTLAAARGAIVIREPRRGYGGACLAAISWITAHDDPTEAIAFIDADLSNLPCELEPLIEALDGHDLVVGCRPRFAERGALNFIQRFGNRTATTMIWLTTGRRFSDLGPMRVIRLPAYERLEMRDRTWGWTVEMQAKAAILGLRVAEVDVPYHRRRFGTSKISGSVAGAVKAGWKIVWTILAVRFGWRPDRAGGASQSSTITLATNPGADG
ncbi:MAG: glycosyltransferase family 2 protein [Phycisphaerales bacterium]